MSATAAGIAIALEIVADALQVAEAAKPFVELAQKMEADGASGDDILDALRNLRVAKEADLDKKLA